MFTILLLKNGLKHKYVAIFDLGYKIIFQILSYRDFNERHK